MKTPLELLAIVCTIACPGAAQAYGSPALYQADPAQYGGGGGRVFTGSPADGLSCDVCHRSEVDTPVGLELLGGPVSGYNPGETYAFTLNWNDEHLAFTAEVTDAQGNPFGELRAPPKSVLLPDETCASGTPAIETLALERGQALALSDCGATSMRLQWTAPNRLTSGALYIGVVSANGDGTPEGDGAAIVEFPLDPHGSDQGCRVGERQNGAIVLVWLLLGYGVVRLRARGGRGIYA